ncbi:hypothetical protein [Sciscionella sediminilitoris]|uniref:hypothetical protein n=1 Tax=Sciscionella sediminilitoris TaxID=1445613 RepID=UPI0012E2FB08|nr:hypothetical protein [Sciscionella sp. SE31]
MELSERLPGWAHWTLLGIGALATVLALVFPARTARKETIHRQAAMQVADEQVARYRTGLHDVLLPLSELLDRVISAKRASDRKAAQNRLTQAVVDLAARHLGQERTRACYFELEHGPPRRLICHGIYSGRDRGPVTVFDETTDDGSHVFANIIDQLSSEFQPAVPSLDALAHRDARPYQTYIACAVSSGEAASGMLTVDAPEKGDLADQDEAFIRLLAQVLGTALAVH